MGLQETMHALADPTRRDILELLRPGRLSAGEIAAHFPISAAAISKHLSVLKEAGLVRDIKRGKYIYYELNTSVLEDVLVFISGLRSAFVDEKGEVHAQ